MSEVDLDERLAINENDGSFLIGERSLDECEVCDAFNQLADEVERRRENCIGYAKMISILTDIDADSKLAKEVELGNSAILKQIEVNTRLRAANAKLLKAMGEIDLECHARTGIGCGYDAIIHAIARAALPQPNPTETATPDGGDESSQPRPDSTLSGADLSQAHLDAFERALIAPDGEDDRGSET